MTTTEFVIVYYLCGTHSRSLVLQSKKRLTCAKAPSMTNLTVHIGVQDL